MERVIWLNPSNSRVGPEWSDYNGELAEPVARCWGCVHHGVHDQHYEYCSAQPADNQNPEKQYAYPWRGAGKHNWLGAENCPFIVK